MNNVEQFAAEVAGTVETSDVLSMDEAKYLAKTGLGAGRKFRTERHVRGVTSPGVRGVILPDLNERGFPQAELECAVEGCTERHIRQSSDWHYSNRCRLHAGKRGTGTRGVRLQTIKPDDSPEVVAYKQAINTKLLEEREQRQKDLQAQRYLTKLKHRAEAVGAEVSP